MALDDAAAGHVPFRHWLGKTANAADYVAEKADWRGHRLLGTDQRVHMVQSGIRLVFQRHGEPNERDGTYGDYERGLQNTTHTLRQTAFCGIRTADPYASPSMVSRGWRTPVLLTIEKIIVYVKSCPCAVPVLLVYLANLAPAFRKELSINNLINLFTDSA